MHRVKSTAAAAALLALLVFPLSLGFGNPTATGGHEPPYNPRPLLEKAGPTGTGAYTVAVFGDSYAVPALRDLMEMVAKQSPTLAVTTGDMVARGGSADTWKTLSARAGWFFDRIPTWPVIGNHELTGGAAAGLRAFEHFYDLSSPNYAFRFRNAKFIVLDHEAGPAPAKQIAFLREELADRDRYDYVFVFRHVPFYTIGSKGEGQVPDKPTALTKLFEQYHVTAVFSGHDHIYYRTKRNGVEYFIAGSAGAPIYQLQRLREGVRGDAYMGRDRRHEGYVVHSPTVTPNPAAGEEHASPDKYLFAILLHVDGKHITVETLSAQGTVWDKFTL